MNTDNYTNACLVYQGFPFFKQKIRRDIHGMYVYLGGTAMPVLNLRAPAG
jgi:hypothetical protein